MPDNAPLKLAAEFPPATEAEWRKLVDGVLKGGPFEKLTSKTYDGLAIAPIYPRAANAAPVAGRIAAPWQIAQRIDDPDAKRANAQALQDLENGATALTLVFEGSNSAHGFGIKPDDLARVLDGIYLDAGVAIDCEIGEQSRDIGERIKTILAERKISPDKTDIRFGFDPIGGAAVRGANGDWNSTAKVFAEKIAGLFKAGFKGPFAAADGRIVHNAGGTEAQELAYVLATMLAYLRALEAAGISLDQARGMIYARMSADADQFLTMAKFRALLKLWARVEQACGLTPAPLFIAAETSWRMLTQRDPDVNMLRATMAVFSAGLGGADSICVLPHTLALGLPDTHARRIARNTQLVLLEESNLAKVSDPAAGSGGIEALTSALCEKAWAQFQAIEKAGGIHAALEAGSIQRDVTATRMARAANIGKRRDVLTGASEFPNLAERNAAVLMTRPVLPPANTPSLTLAPYRLAEGFEALRDRSDRMLKENRQRPQVALITLGGAADFTARVQFAKSFFEAGGIEAVEADAAKASSSTLACLCSSDKIYAEQATTIAKSLRERGFKSLYLAGRPGEQQAAYENAGITSFIFAGCDALEILNGAYQKLTST